MADKKGRIQQVIQRNLSEIIIYGLKTPICQYASINEVRMNDDYSFCKIYVSHLEEDKTDSLVNFLNNNAKKIRSLLSKTLDIYKVPELRFYKDEVYQKARHIDDVIKRALEKKPVTLKDLDNKKEE